MEIEGRQVTTEKNYLDPVTYVPNHAKGNAGHKDCQQGVIIEVREGSVMVLYCHTRTVQATNPSDLVWG
ncbi:hypothetical protein LCGC14_1815570 [marine sediment metagenome]|uniref:Uncharacterized protein n=1 Tax=marine sediment metagenome TaxID=412755 RepID=A0A0F9GKD3_9ZZZZ